MQDNPFLAARSANCRVSPRATLLSENDLNSAKSKFWNLFQIIFIWKPLAEYSNRMSLITILAQIQGSTGRDNHSCFLYRRGLAKGLALAVTPLWHGVETDRTPLLKFWGFTEQLTFWARRLPTGLLEGGLLGSEATPPPPAVTWQSYSASLNFIIYKSD